MKNTNNENDLVLVPLELIESLKDFDTWKTFKNNPDFLNENGCEIIKKNKEQSYTCPWDNYSGTHFGY